MAIWKAHEINIVNEEQTTMQHTPPNEVPAYKGYNIQSCYLDFLRVRLFEFSCEMFVDTKKFCQLLVILP